jgi:hypothetical protein
MPVSKKSTFLCFLLMLSLNTFSQSGIYRKTDKTGASCTIAIILGDKNIHADIFAWWHTASETHGTFSGDGVVRNSKAVFKGNEDGSNCTINFDFKPKALTATFEDCMTYNLPEDFSGNYIKITDRIPGNYIVVTDKAYFFKLPEATAKLKNYLVKGDQVDVDIENIINENWVFVNFTNIAGKSTSAYMQWKDLKSKN